jgi:septal ring factor EnvC (AmiA/AmiB activator)
MPSVHVPSVHVRDAQCGAVQDKQDSYRPLQQELGQERVAHADAREKLSSARAELGRKGALVDDLKQRIQALQASIVEHRTDSERLSAAESAVKELQVTLQKKNASIKEARLLRLPLLSCAPVHCTTAESK